jgi:hypothetical protein
MTADERTPRDRDLFEAVKAVVLDAREHFIQWRDAGKYIPRYHDWSKLDYFDSGFPRISTDHDAEVPDYDRLFGVKETQWTPIGYGEWDSFQRLASYVEGHERIRDYLGYSESPAVSEEDRRTFFLISVGIVAFQVFERVVHTKGADFSEEDISPTYCEVEMPLLLDKLPIWMMVPIALTHFDFTGWLPVGENIAVAKMPDDIQLARAPRGSIYSGANEVVVGAATHALVLTNWEMPNDNRFSRGLDNINWYPTEIIDRFFDSLRVVTGVETGYAQVFVNPMGWATSYRAHLRPVMQGAFVRRYPASFDSWGWLKEREPVTEGQFTNVADLYQALTDSGDTALPLSAQRLSTAMLRDNERDAILDLIIGLEALLGDETTTEVTHKLALRTAAVLAGLDDERTEPQEVFKAVKSLYGYRSAVAHGNAKTMEKKKTVRLEGGGEVPAVDLATSYLRRVIRVLASQPDLRSGKAVDESVILPALAGAGHGEEEQRGEESAPTPDENAS